MTTLEFSRLTVSYGERIILRDISFSLADDAGVTAIIGPSGAGKSTLLKTATRTLDFERDPHAARRYGSALLSGFVLKDGHDIEHEPAHLYRRKVGHCLQEPVMLPGTVGYNLDAPLQLVRPEMSRSERQRRSAEALAQVGLENIPLSRRPGEISGGQRQRVTIARAFVLEPEILFLDEPTAALDPVAKRQILNLCLQLSETVPVVIVTHDMDLARQCHRVILIAEHSSAPDQGARVICDGCPQELFSQAMPTELARMADAFATA